MYYQQCLYLSILLDIFIIIIRAQEEDSYTSPDILINHQSATQRHIDCEIMQSAQNSFWS